MVTAQKQKRENTLWDIQSQHYSHQLMCSWRNMSNCGSFMLIFVVAVLLCPKFTSGWIEWFPTLVCISQGCIYSTKCPLCTLNYNRPFRWKTHQHCIHWGTSPLWDKGLSSVWEVVPVVLSAGRHLFCMGRSSTGRHSNRNRWGEKKIYKSQEKFTEELKIKHVYRVL